MPFMTAKLNIHAHNVTSQHGEDGIIQFILANMKSPAIEIACEVGAWDGIFASNIYSLWHDRGWRGVLIEADAAKFSELQRNTADRNTVCLNFSIEASGPRALERIFTDANLPHEIGVLSLDIDSFDYHVWNEMKSLRPQVAIVEHNQNIPPHVDYYDPPGHVYLKCSAKALERVGRDKGYKLICCTQVNSIFVREDLFNADAFPNMPVEWLFDYSELKPQVIFTGEGGNMFPVFSRPARSVLKWWLRLYYRLSALPKPRRTYCPPSAAVRSHLKHLGLDA